jgi:hypothetical protein
MVESIIRNDTLDNTSMHEVDAWSKTNDTLRIIKNGIETSEEWLTEYPLVDVIVLERDKAFVSITDINNKRFWSEFHVISVINKQ